ncbi:MAG TPA: 50S ribosomal protein L4 [Candidatus Polarisedimenticolia bacterium]|nr:50S ribosomal protein L4 [Candidatus Polarisedimenticolia bacterium]
MDTPESPEPKPTIVKVRDLENREVREFSLPGTVFSVEPNRPLIYEAVRAYTAAARRGTHDTKTRAEVSGSGRKLWKQKKTGRARIGSVRSPLWRHGGTVHGPTPRSYAYAFPRRKRAGALRVAMSQKLREGRLMIVDNLELDSHKTKAFAQRILKLGVQGSALLLDEPVPRNLNLAARNLPTCKVGRASGVNIVDVLRHDWVVVTEAGARKLSEVLTP